MTTTVSSQTKDLLEKADKLVETALKADTQTSQRKLKQTRKRDNSV